MSMGKTQKQPPRVVCAICNKLVDEVLEAHDYCNNAWRLKVRCHGDTDEMSIPLFNMTPEQVCQIKDQEGIAFSVKRIWSGGAGGDA